MVTSQRAGVPVPLPDPALVADQALLRPWSDARAVFEALSDRDVLRFSWAAACPYAAQDARDHLVDQERRLDGTGLQQAVVAPQDGRLLPGDLARARP